MPRPATRVTLLFIVALAGCASTVETAPGTSSVITTSTTGTGGSSSTTGTDGDDAVIGTAVDHRYFHEQSHDDPVDLTASSIRALVQEGGSWQTIQGLGHADGSFEIPGVPHGPYVLALDDVYLYTSARVVDFGQQRLGRRDVTQAPKGTVIAATVGNLEPWEPNEHLLEWHCPDSTGSGGPFVGAEPTPGDTALTGQMIAFWNGLVEGSKGDVLYGAQLAERTSSKGSSYSAVTRFASFAGLDMVPGGVTDVQGTFTTVTADHTMNVDFRGSEFMALTGSVGPSVVPAWHVLDISATPGGRLAGMELGEVDTDYGSISWGNPYPASWKTMALVEFDWSMEILAPSATSPHDFWAHMLIWAPPEELGAGPIRPVLSPVQNPRVNGLDAFSAQSGITTTPTLSWDPPAIGTPVGYWVVPYRVFASGDGTEIDWKAPSLVTTSTTLTLPPGVIEPGDPYVFVIWAFSGDHDFATQPLGWNDLRAMTSSLTAPMTP